MIVKRAESISFELDSRGNALSNVTRFLNGKKNREKMQWLNKGYNHNLDYNGMLWLQNTDDT